VPLFSGIRKRGAGLGPAIAFLLAAPALDIVPIMLTFRLLGAPMGWAHLLGIAAFSVIMGLTMQAIFKETPESSNNGFAAMPDIEISKHWWVHVVFFGLMIVAMVFALSQKWLVAGGALLALILFWIPFYSREDLRSWMDASFQFIRSIIPWLLIGTAGAALIAGFMPSGLVLTLTGGDSFRSTLTSSFLGTLLYICPPSEVLFTRAFVDLGMGLGPALAFLLTAPAVSFPSIVILGRIIGWKKALTNTILLLLLAAVTGFIFGMIVH
jgi:uncharacterized protein